MIARVASTAQQYANSSKGSSPYDSDSDWDLDVELQRLLGEELQAMEPGPMASEPVYRAAAAPAEVGGSGTAISLEGGTAAAAASAPASSAVYIPTDDAQTQTMIASLSERISKDLDGLYQRMTTEVGAQRAAYDEIANLLQSARAALLNGPTGVVEAERMTRQAEGLLKNKEDSQRWASKFGSLILGYEIVFFSAFVLLLAFDRQLAAWAGSWTKIPTAVSMADILPFWNTMVWGGIGGVIGGLYSLYWHVTEKQDFDRRYNMWYVVQPVMGAMLGGLVYLIVASGMLAMKSDAPPASYWFPSAVACLCGFRQKFIYELLDKVMEVIGLQPLWNKALGTKSQ